MTEAAQLTMDGRELSMAEVAADRGIERVARGATSPEWFDMALFAVRQVAEPYATDYGLFTTDDVWEAVDTWASTAGVDPAPPEPRAMGAVMRRAVAEGICIPTDEYRKSERPQCHGRPVRVWRARR